MEVQVLPLTFLTIIFIVHSHSSKILADINIRNEICEKREPSKWNSIWMAHGFRMCAFLFLSHGCFCRLIQHVVLHNFVRKILTKLLKLESMNKTAYSTTESQHLTKQLINLLNSFIKSGYKRVLESGFSLNEAVVPFRSQNVQEKWHRK